MHKSESRTNLSIINHVIMVNELKVKTIGIHKSTDSLIIQFWSWFNIVLKRINYTPIPYINNNETKLEFVTFYPLHADFLWADIRNIPR